MTVKELREPLYDTYVVAAAASPAALPANIPFFSTGKTPGTKGIDRTNMNDNGQLPSPERMSVYRVPRIVFLGMIEADIVAMCQTYVARLTVAGGEVFTGPIEYCAAGGGASSAAQNGLQTPEAVIVLPEEFRIDIESGQKFVFELVTASTPVTPTATGASTPGKGVFIRVLLDGVHTLPIG